MASKNAEIFLIEKSAVNIRFNIDTLLVVKEVNIIINSGNILFCHIFPKQKLSPICW